MPWPATPPPAVVAVTSNTSFADTASVALKIAEAFATTARVAASP